MNIVFDKTLKLLRYKIYPLVGKHPELPELQWEMDREKSQRIIIDLLRDDKPCMIARFGSVELEVTVNYLGVKHAPHSVWKYIKGETPQWWWNQKSLRMLQSNAGFYPITEEMLCRYAERMIEDARELDVLGCYSWQKRDKYVEEQYKNAQKVKLGNLEPSYLDGDEDLPTWTAELKGKRVLVVHPFADTIQRQFEHREHLFKRDDILPEFELKTIKAVQSLGGKNSDFKDWFEALHWMEQEIDKIEYDICLIGCGAYGFPLAAHVKRMGHKAFHLGGSLQLLFGIKGKRWEERPEFQKLFNDYWVNPSKQETPSAANLVEGGCYW